MRVPRAPPPARLKRASAWRHVPRHSLTHHATRSHASRHSVTHHATRSHAEAPGRSTRTRHCAHEARLPLLHNSPENNPENQPRKTKENKRDETEPCLYLLSSNSASTRTKTNPHSNRAIHKALQAIITLNKYHPYKNNHHQTKTPWYKLSKHPNSRYPN